MVAGRRLLLLLLLLQLEGRLVHIPGRRRNNVSLHSRRSQVKGAGSDKSLAKGHLRRDKVYSGRDGPSWKLSRARWLQYSGGLVGRAGQGVLGGRVVRRPWKSVPGASWRPGACNYLVALDSGRGQCCSDAVRQRLCASNWSWAGQIERFKSRDF